MVQQGTMAEIINQEIFGEINQDIADLKQADIDINSDVSTLNTKVTTINNNLVAIEGVFHDTDWNASTHKLYTEIEYPEGFTKNNCMVTSIMGSEYNYSIWALYNGFADEGMDVVLADECIGISYRNVNFNAGFDFQYKLLLQKIESSQNQEPVPYVEPTT